MGYDQTHIWQVTIIMVTLIILKLNKASYNMNITNNRKVYIKETKGISIFRNQGQDKNIRRRESRVLWETKQEKIQDCLSGESKVNERSKQMRSKRRYQIWD